MRRVVGIDLGREPVPDETTVCRFRRLLEEHDLGRRLFDEIHRTWPRGGLRWLPGQLSMQRSSIRPHRPRMPTRPEIPRGTRRKKETAWISLDGPNACDSSYIPYINHCNIDAEQTF
jgi:IS5 family transposase